MMYKTNKRSIFPTIMVMALLLLTLFPARVFAEGEEPRDGGSAPAGEPGTEAAIETPVAESAAKAESLPEPQVNVVKEENLSAVVEALEAADAVLVDEKGDAIPVASVEALAAMEGINSGSSDPFFTYSDGSITIVVGYTHPGIPCHPSVTECHETPNPIQAVLNDSRSSGVIIYIDGPAANYANDTFTLDTPRQFQLMNNEDITVHTIYLNTSLANIGYLGNNNRFFAQNVFVLGGGTTASIQDGINLAADGGTVNVAAGTYREQVKIKKSVSLKGAGKDTTKIVPDPSFVHCWGPPCGPGDRALVEINGGNENAAGYTIQVLLDGFTLDGEYLYGNKFGVLVHGGAYAEISNNHVKNFYDHANPGGNQVNVLAGYWGQDWPWSGSAGKWYFTGHANMHDNVVSGFNTVGMMIWGPNSTGTIDHNIINPDPTDPHLSAGAMGIVLQNSGAVTISNNLVTNLVTPGGPTGGSYRSGLEAYWPGNTTVFGNTFLNNDYGLSTYNNWPQPPSSTFSIDSNVFEGNQVGLQLGGLNITSLTGNSFINNVVVGVTNTMTKIVDATGNWWGQADGPSALPETLYENNNGLGAPTGSGDAISDYLIYDPFLKQAPGENGGSSGGTGGGASDGGAAIVLPVNLANIIPVTGMDYGMLRLLASSLPVLLIGTLMLTFGLAMRLKKAE